LISTVRLGEITEFINGGPWNESEYVESGIPVVRVSDFTENTVSLAKCKFLSRESWNKYSKHRLLAGDLVVATVGSHPTQPASVVGRPVIIPQSAEGALLNQNAVCIRPKGGSIDKTYLGYLGCSKSFRDYIVAHARGAANQARMSIALLKEMRVPLPSLTAQRKIAAILSGYDNLIGNNQQRIRILNEIILAIYREWFTRFNFHGLESSTVDSPLGQIPEGWGVSTFAELFSGERNIVLTGPFGSKLHASDYRPHGVPLILVKHVKDGHIEEQNLPLVGSHKTVELDRYRLRTGDIIVTRVGFVGESAYVHHYYNDWLFSGQMLRVRLPTNGRLHARYLSQYYLTPAFKKSIQGHAVGTTRPSLNTDILMSMPILVPPYHVQSAFVEFVSPIDEMIQQLHRKNSNLVQIRDLLLSRLITDEASELDISEGSTVI
jgi:type I restriction enzyme S subunit